MAGYVAQLLPDEELEELKILLTALNEFVSKREHDYNDPQVLAAEELKLKLITDVRRKRG